MLCKCGCGESLPPGSVRQYKRGHKSNPPDRIYTDGGVADSTTALFAATEVDDSGDEIQDDVPDSLAAIRDAIEPDPEPERPVEDKPVRRRVTAKQRSDIEGKLGMVFAMTAATWSVRDPYCADAFVTASPDIASKMVPLICKSPQMVEWFTKSGGYMDWFELAMAFLPVGRAIFAHHIVKSAGQEPRAQDLQTPPFEYSIP